MEFSVGLPQWVVLAVAAQRVSELFIARRNTARLLSRGAVEHGREHYPLFVLLHAVWLISIFFFVPSSAPIIGWLISVFVLLQLGRIWVIRSLGEYWTTRIINLSEQPLIRSGPYRWMKHPNYLVVALEVAVLPLAFGAWHLAVVFTALNSLLLWWRIRVENTALSNRLQ